MSNRKKRIEPPGELLTNTRQQLNNRPVWLTFQLIADETELPYPWLITLSNDEDCRPQVHRVEHLHKYLKLRLAKGEQGKCPFPLS